MLKGGKDKIPKTKGKKEVHYVEVPTVVTEVISQECEETISVRPSVVYPPGTDMTPSGCRLVVHHEMIAQPVASITDIIAPLMECPIGFTECGGHKKKHGGSGCCMTEELPADADCDFGYQDMGTECLKIEDAE